MDQNVVVAFVMKVKLAVMIQKVSAVALASRAVIQTRLPAVMMRMKCVTMVLVFLSNSN